MLTLLKGIQSELARVGCYPGDHDGKWGPAVRGAIEKFNKTVKGSIASDAPTKATLALLAGSEDPRLSAGMWIERKGCWWSLCKDLTPQTNGADK